MRSRKLQNIAQGIAGSFVSRNNDVDGYWAMGMLRALADRQGVDRLTIRFDASAEPDNLTIAAITFRYAMILARLLEKSGHAQDWVSDARIQVEFERGDRASDPSMEVPTVCEVHLEDRRGYAALIRRTTSCRHHDPRREYRRIRKRMFLGELRRVDQMGRSLGKGSRFRITHLAAGVSVLGESNPRLSSAEVEAEKARLLMRLLSKVRAGSVN